MLRIFIVQLKIKKKKRKKLPDQLTRVRRSRSFFANESNRSLFSSSIFKDEDERSSRMIHNDERELYLKRMNEWKTKHLFLSFVLFIRRFDCWSSISIHKLRRETNVEIVHREQSITYVLLVILFYHLVICLIWLCQYWTMMRDICNEHRDHLFSHRFVIRHRNRNEEKGKRKKGNTKILLNVYVSVDQWREQERDDDR